MTPKLLLVPVDFSSPALSALEYAIDLAGRLEAEVALVHVFEPSYYAPPDLVGSGTLLGVLFSEQEKSARAQLLRLERRYTKRGVKLRAFLQTGAPALAIADTAEQLGADLIVMATHGRTGVAHVLLGSVAEQVVRKAPCPVLTVRRHEARRTRKAPAEHAKKRRAQVYSG